VDFTHNKDRMSAPNFSAKNVAYLRALFDSFDPSEAQSIFLIKVLTS